MKDQAHEEQNRDELEKDLRNAVEGGQPEQPIQQKQPIEQKQ